MFGKDYVERYFSKPEISTQSVKTHIQDLGQLATFQTSYRGVAEVMGEPNRKGVVETAYYAYYEAVVKFGIEFEEVDFVPNEERQKLIVILPETKLLSIVVDENSFEYIFLDSDYDTMDVKFLTHGFCEQDLEQEIQDLSSMFEYATEGAENTLRALIEPFLSNYDGNYTLEFQREQVSE